MHGAITSRRTPHGARSEIEASIECRPTIVAISRRGIAVAVADADLDLDPLFFLPLRRRHNRLRPRWPLVRRPALEVRPPRARPRGALGGRRGRALVDAARRGRAWRRQRRPLPLRVRAVAVLGDEPRERAQEQGRQPDGARARGRGGDGRRPALPRIRCLASLPAGAEARRRRRRCGAPPREGEGRVRGLPRAAAPLLRGGRRPGRGREAVAAAAGRDAPARRRGHGGPRGGAASGGPPRRGRHGRRPLPPLDRRLAAAPLGAASPFLRDAGQG